MITDAQVDAAIRAHWEALPFHGNFEAYIASHDDEMRAQIWSTWRRQMRAALEAAERVKVVDQILQRGKPPVEPICVGCTSGFLSPVCPVHRIQ